MDGKIKNLADMLGLEGKMHRSIKINGVWWCGRLVEWVSHSVLRKTVQSDVEGTMEW